MAFPLVESFGLPIALVEVHVAFPLVEGLGRPQTCSVKGLSVGGSRLPKPGMPGVGLPFCQ